MTVHTSEFHGQKMEFRSELEIITMRNNNAGFGGKRDSDLIQVEEKSEVEEEKSEPKEEKENESSSESTVA